MEITPIVSVIIPNYCHSHFLDQRIQSVLNQTFQDFEVIILDDCSPDNDASKAIIEKYRSNSHVTHIVYNEKNSGSTFRQWHKGFKLAKGQWIWIAESDDFCEVNYLKVLTDCIRNDETISVIYCSSIFVNSEGMVISPQAQWNYNQYRYKGSDFIAKRMGQGNGICNASAALFRKEFALSVKKDYMKYQAAGDRLFWIYMAEMGDVLHVNEELNYFRQHAQKVTPQKTYDGTSLREEYKINKYIVQKGYLNCWERLHSSRFYFQKIHYSNFASDEKKKELYRLWNFNGIIQKTMMLLFVKLNKLLYMLKY